MVSDLERGNAELAEVVHRSCAARSYQQSPDGNSSPHEIEAAGKSIDHGVLP
jgi:hypothetical protein